MDALAAAQFGFAPALASALLHSLWQDSLLALAAWVALAGLSRQSAALRHTVGMVFLLAMVLAPALRFVGFWRQTPVEMNAGLLPAMSAIAADATGGVFTQQSSPVAAVVVALWLVGVLLVVLRHVGGLVWLRRIERGPFQPLPPAWTQRVDELRAALGIARAVCVRVSSDALVPFTARLLRPVIWVPLALLTRTPPEQLEALLAHELAHIARRDWLWNGLQCVLEALLFFHPAAWWLGRRIRAEREHACDDLAVVACGDAIALAEALVALERERHAPRLVLAAQGGPLMNRITRLLATRPTRGRWGAAAALGVVLTAGALFAVQAGFAGNWKPDLNVRSNTDGALGPGDYREYTANGVDGERYYRVDIASDGKRTEVYKRNGDVRPIDADARRWIAGVQRLSLLPPPPPPPPAPPAPPMPPAPPVPPDPMDSAEFQALVKVIVARPDVVARLGTPVTVVREPVSGNLRLHDTGENGDADMRFTLAGPKGRAQVDVEATRKAGQWTVDELDLD